MWENWENLFIFYFEALIAIIFIENGISATKRFLQRISFFSNVEIICKAN